MQILLAQPRGFCAGVVRAVEIVERALGLHGAPIYVFHEIVHNRHVVEDLSRRGAIFVESIDSIPHGAVTVFSAHGVSDAIVAAARARDLHVIDATCPLVTRVHLRAARYSRAGYAVVIIGHRGHEEVEGTMGSVPGPVHVVSSAADVATLSIAAGAPIAYVTQTTLSLDDTREVIEALRERYPDIEGPELDDICYATQNRQNAVRELAAKADVVLVVGSRNSSNSNRLREVAAQLGVPSYLIENADELDRSWLHGRHRIGVTAGASAPEVLVTAVRQRLAEWGATDVVTVGSVQENVTFRVPAELALPSRKTRKTDRAA